MKTEFAEATKPLAPDAEEIKKFHDDIRFGRTADFQAFLDKFGASGVEAKFADGGTLPLMNASWSGRIDMVRTLLDRGANIEGRDDKGHTALMAAAWQDKAPIVRLLLERGADVEARNETGLTPLIFSTYNNGVASARELLARGASATAASDSSWTPIIQAMVNGKTEVALVLFNCGVDIHAPGKDGKSAVDYAREYHHEDTVAALEGAVKDREDAYVENEVRRFGEYAVKGTPAPVAVKSPLRLKRNPSPQSVC